ncbi:PREDICTED: mavicyanin [Theobroma cacao]|uniref:Mavicyanin n=1 Tax=Theobroma cacao TaxID=3641 RepID=A0AB32V801_THECC|nr:PREDICTED: mavicyanin [Theobroma cacao]
MALAERVVAQALLLVMAASLQLSHAAVYKVGDSGGWTSIGNIDFKQWAATKTFQVGDIIHFEYNAQYHNVMRVTHPMYRACNATAPLATYTTGNDTITITTKGHHYFLCGVPGHCQAGQKVDINVLRISETAPTPSPSGLSPPPSFPSVGIPAPSPSKATSLKASKGSFSKLGLAMAAFAVFVSGFH